jgi:hypothetical protein
MNEPLAPKAKWKHRKTYRKVRDQVQLLESAIKPTKRCKKPINIGIFAYHLAGLCLRITPHKNG